MQFDDQFFQSIGLGNSTEEEKADMVQKLAELVQGRVAVKMSEGLTEEQLERFDTLLEEGKEDEAMAYAEEAYPNYAVMVQGEVDAVKQEFASDVQAVAEQIEANQNAQQDPGQPQ